MVLALLRSRQLPGRLAEAVPWVLLTFADLDWRWLVDQSKLSNLQNRLGYFVSMARSVAAREGSAGLGAALLRVEQTLDEARLVREDTLGRTLTEVERHYLREHRPQAAVHWNVLTTLTPESLRYAV